MRVDAFATQTHYLEHLAPVWHGLREAERGHIYVNQNFYEFEPVAKALKLQLARGRPPFTTDPLIMASGADLWGCSGRPVVLIEHGAGQSYVGTPDITENVCYSGGRGRNAVRLFLSPNERSAQKNRDVYPDVPVYVVGDPTIVPKPVVPSKEPVVAISWHWDCPMVPETRTSWAFWRNTIISMGGYAGTPPPGWPGYRILGHAHPKIQHEIMPWWTQNRFAATRHFRRVAQAASLFVCDNSSCLYEFAALDRPVLVLDAPFYRRDVEHGLRFWEYADVGMSVSKTMDLQESIWEALKDPPEVAERRREITKQIYPYVGAKATQRSVDAIREVFA